MASQTSKVKVKLANLSTSLSELESLLEPLLAHSLPESILGLEPIQQAKLQTVLPYVVYDLVFIYLKTKGVDPKTHPVVSELDRVRYYFEKVNNAESSPTRRIEVDKEAAGRFIRHAIARTVPTLHTKPRSVSPLPRQLVPVKITTKMVARAQYEEALQAAYEEQEEEEELDIYGEPQSESDNSKSPMISAQADLLAEVSPEVPAFLRRGRPPVDPFAGYGEGDSTTAEPFRKQS